MSTPTGISAASPASSRRTTSRPVYSRASPHNCVCVLRPIFCPIRAGIKGGNTYSIPALLSLSYEAKSLAECACQIVRCCPRTPGRKQYSTSPTRRWPSTTAPPFSRLVPAALRTRPLWRAPLAWPPLGSWLLCATANSCPSWN